MGNDVANIELVCSQATMERRTKQRGRPDDDPKIALNRYAGYQIEMAVIKAHLGLGNSRYLEVRQCPDSQFNVSNNKQVSSEEDGEEGWKFFKDALLVSSDLPNTSQVI